MARNYETAMTHEQTPFTARHHRTGRHSREAMHAWEEGQSRHTVPYWLFESSLIECVVCHRHITSAELPAGCTAAASLVA